MHVILAAGEIQEITGVQIGNWIVPIAGTIIAGLFAAFVASRSGKSTKPSNGVTDSVAEIVKASNKLNQRADRYVRHAEEKAERSEAALTRALELLEAANKHNGEQQTRLTAAERVCDEQQLEINELRDKIAGLHVESTIVDTTTPPSEG